MRAALSSSLSFLESQGLTEVLRGLRGWQWGIYYRHFRIRMGLVRNCAELPFFTGEVRIASELIAESFCVLWLEAGCSNADFRVEFVDEGLHTLACADNKTGRVCPRFGQPTNSECSFRLTIFAQEWRVANDAVESVLQTFWQSSWTGEIVEDKFLEDREAFVELEQYYPRLD